MMVLMISEKDAANSSLSVIEREFRKKGHTVDIYAPYISKNTLRMFDEEARIESIDGLTKEKISHYDIIFASVFSLLILMRNKLLCERKYIFTYDYYTHGEIVNGGDFNFAPSLYNTTSLYNKDLKFAKMGIGEPKFDILQKCSVDSNRLLFIDSGHYPFGREGKEELALLLLSICEKFPEYELCVKPRFLPKDEVVTHVNTMHLYDVLEQMAGGNLPLNLTLLKQHLDLEELINNSKTILCMYTTAYISAIVANKGLVIIDGLPNEDTYDIRHKRFLQTREGMRGSKALIKYKNVLNYLPEGIRSPKEFIDREVVYTDNVAEKIVSVVEYIHDQYISKGRFPDNNTFEFDKYSESIKPKENATWETVISDRLENTLKHLLLINFDFRVNANLNLDRLIGYIDSFKSNQLLSEEAFYRASSQIKSIVADILIDNHLTMLQDDIDEGILLEAYYLKKDYESIKNVKDRGLGAYYFFRGKVAVDEKEVQLAKFYLEKYEKITHNRPYIKEVSDMPHYRADAYHLLVKILLDEGEFQKAQYYLNSYEKLCSDRAKQSGSLSAIVNREVANNELYKRWTKFVSEGNLDSIQAKLSTDQIMIYGAGTITENLILPTEPLMKKVKLLIDQKSDSAEKFGLPLISPEEIVNYNEIGTIIVTVPHAFEQIRKHLLTIRNDIKVISINELIN